MLTFDTETELITPGCPTPRVVIYQAQRSSNARDVGKVEVLLRSQAPGDHLLAALREGEHITGHNVAFDLGVLCAESPKLLRSIFRAHAEDRVHDTMIREQLIEIASGRFASLRSSFDLGSLAKRYLGKKLDKGAESYRYSFGRWINAESLEEIEPLALKYAREDVRSTRAIYYAQEPRCRKYFDQSAPPDEGLQTRAAWALHLMGVWGVRTDRRVVETLITEWTAKHERASREMEAQGLLRTGGARAGAKNMKAIEDRIVAVLGKDTPRTPTGKPKTDADTIDLIGEQDPVLGSMVIRNRASKILSTYLLPYREGYERPICPRWNVLVETGRTSCSKPNFQNVPRLFGIREAIVPREGFVFIRADYAQSELVSLASVCLSLVGWSKMADALIRGFDLHLMLAASIVGTNYDRALALFTEYKQGKREKQHKAIQEARQIAKVANFGFPGGLGARSFVAYYHGFMRDNPSLPSIDEAKAERLKAAWRKTWPEMRDYFEIVGDLTADYGPKRIVQDGTGRVRGDVTFTEAANGLFQGKTADGAKDAVFDVSRACYVDRSSALYGSRPVLFIHDELVLESPEDCAAEAAEELAARMIERMSAHVPGLPVKCEPAIMRRWYKGAETVRDKRGRLVPWEPTHG